MSAVLVGLVVLAGLFVRIGTRSSDAVRDEAASIGELPRTAGVDERAPRIGEPVTDVDMSFVVNGVECGATTLGDLPFGVEAQGQFCVVDLTMTNTGDEMESFSGDHTTLLNAEGQRFAASTMAAIYLDDDFSVYEEINPGNTLNSRVVFDVPPGMAPTAIQLRDSRFTMGVTVLLE